MEVLAREPTTGRRGCPCGSWEFHSYGWGRPEPRMFLLDEGGDRADRLEEIYWVTEWPQRSDEVLNGPIDGRIQCAGTNCAKIFEIRKGKQAERAKA